MKNSIAAVLFFLKEKKGLGTLGYVVYAMALAWTKLIYIYIYIHTIKFEIDDNYSLLLNQNINNLNPDE